MPHPTVASLTALREALAALDLPLPLAGVELAATTRDEALAQVDDYLLPRLSNVDAPLLAVLGGSTGAGKSTLTNSMVGDVVSTAGVLRPTTRSPVLVHHPDDAWWFAGDGVLPELPRQTGERGTGRALHLAVTDQVPRGLGILDSPDIDSVEVANHELAAQLLGAADLWVFVTTAARYADAVPWDYLARASERGAAIGVVVNRIPPTDDGSAVREILADVRRMLNGAGLDGARLFGIEERPPVEGLLLDGVAEVKGWIEGLVADAEQRAAVVRQTVQGAVDSLWPRIGRVLEAAREQATAAAAMAEVSVAQERAATRVVTEQLGSGVLLRGEVLERFREQVGTAAWMDRLQRQVGRLRDRIAGAFTGRDGEVDAVRGQLRSNLVGLVDDAVTGSLERTVEAWRHLPGGSAVLHDQRPYATAIGPVEELVAEWQDGVVELIRETAGSKVSVARGLTLGINGIGVTLMMGIFASTGGLTGGEVAVAGGTAAFSQAVLSAVFGEQAIRDLARKAREDLLDRVAALAEQRHTALRDLLDSVPGDDTINAVEVALEELSR